MTEKAKPHNILVSREYESGGEKKTDWMRVGVAFPTKSGDGFSCEIADGLALTGRFMILPRTNRAEDDGAQGEE